LERNVRRSEPKDIFSDEETTRRGAKERDPAKESLSKDWTREEYTYKGTISGAGCTVKDECLRIQATDTFNGWKP